MCGIAGLINQRWSTCPTELLQAMGDSMRFRGPDDYGQFCYGKLGMMMQRLAVIDCAGGHQPLFNSDRSILAFQNGEMYNYMELRAELEAEGFHFRTKSDTEVIAQGYQRWGALELFRRLDGMFALAIFDQNKEELILARDRFGEKPLFYFADQNAFAYSSNALSLAALPFVPEGLCSSALNHYLRLHFSCGRQTIFSSIKRLLPGEFIRVRLSDLQLKIEPYYRLRPCKGPRVSGANLKHRLEHAVQSRMIADVPVGIFLSGGLDSSMVAAIAARKNPGIMTFSMGFSSALHDESSYAREVAEKLGTTHFNFTFNSDAFQDFLPKVVHALDEPIGDQALLPLYWLCAEARKHVTVVLSGEGADEVFGGYSYYKQFCRPANLLERFVPFLRASRCAPNIASFFNEINSQSASGFPLITNLFDRDALLDHSPDPEGWEAEVVENLNACKTRLQAAQLCDIFSWLTDNLLIKFDRMAMAHSLEGRAPYLEPNLVQMVLSAPDEQRINQFNNKLLLRKAAESFIPATILSRPKQGFVLPMRSWLAQWFENIDNLRAYINNAAIPYLKPEALHSMISQDLEQGVSNERRLFALLLLIEWHKDFQLRLKKTRTSYQEALKLKEPLQIAL